MVVIDKRVYGGIEAGGTKFVCAAGTGPDDIREITRIPTTTPDETIAKVVEFFSQPSIRNLAGIGIGSFGPIDLNPASPTWGYITSTPKTGWKQTDLAGKIEQALRAPVKFDTDVNAAALGEKAWGAAKGLDNFIYLTVGTGIGGGAMVNGQLLHGLTHPEMGHILVPHNRERDPYLGGCPYHGDCLEGLASGEAMRIRWKKPAEELPPDHQGWALEADYLAAGLMNFICTLSPERIIIGGGVMKQERLLPMVRKYLSDILIDYIDHPAITKNIDTFIVPPALGEEAGVLGAIALAKARM